VIVFCPASVLRLSVNNISPKTVIPISSKLHRNNPLVVSFKNYLKNLIPCKTLVSKETERSFFEKPIQLELRYLA
jgi:hypothetical protein